MKHYVFWRLPTGKLQDRTNDGPALRHILAEIGKRSTVKDGKISWTGFVISIYETSLKPSLAVVGPNGDELNPADAWQLNWAALKVILLRLGGGKPILPQEFLQEADKQAALFFRKPLNAYVLVSSLSIVTIPAKTIRFSDSKLKFLPDRGKFLYPESIDRSHSHISDHLKKSQDKIVALEVSGRSPHEAANRAISDLNTLRGLWTLFTQYQSWSMSFGSTKRKPIGVIHSGPVYTLHDPDGKLVGDIFWCDTDFDTESRAYSPNSDWIKIEEMRKWAMRRLKILPYGAELNDILARYAVALDQLNLDVAFIYLWSILEKLTDTVGAKYDDTISRSVWAYSDREVAAEMLGAMRLLRNRFVHSARSSDDREQVVLMVKRFIEPHLLRLIRNDFKVSSFEEYGRQLSHSTNIETLKKQRHRIGRTIRFLNKAKKK